MKPFIDHTIFLGMHSADEKTRIACKNLIINNFTEGVCMTLEEVGKCDDVVWQRERAEQDHYYPFMDVLHTDMKIQRVPYTATVMNNAITNDLLSPQQRLLLAMAKECKCVLFTLDAQLLHIGSPFVLSPIESASEYVEKKFSNTLEQLYENSLLVRFFAT